MKNIRRALRGALVAAPALLLLGCGDNYGTDPQQTFMGCQLREIYVDQARGGTLNGSDCIVQGAYSEMYYFNVDGYDSNRNFIIDLESFDFDAYLVLYDFDTGELLAENDNINGFDTDARLTGTLPQGRYVISATTFDTNEIGEYVLTVD